VIDDAAFGTARLGPVADAPPSVPTNLAATTPSPTSVNLNWTASSDDIGVAGYDVVRDGAPLVSLHVVTTYLDTTILAGSTHSYAVRARDTSGNRSGLSAPVSATTTTDVPPSIPIGLTATASSAFSVDLAWSASSDDHLPLAGYDVFRGGTPIATLGDVTSWTDTTVLASTLYSYAVRARDGAGNLSALSDPAPVTTPAASTPAFVNGFESGDTAWTTKAANLQVQSIDVRTGGFAGEGNVVNLAAYARKTVAPTIDAYARVWFKVKSQGPNQVTLLSLRDSGSFLRSVFLTAGGNVGMSGGTSTAAPTQGVWHALELHIAVSGSTSPVQVWLDGAPVSGLPTTLNLGTAIEIVELQVGDSQATTRTYDVVYDDAAFGTARIGL
jgi:hypothetical protein